MAKRKTNKDGYIAVIKALEAKGYPHPQSDLARLLGFKGRQNVWNWKGEVPELHAFKVSLISGVPIEQILPDVIEKIHAKLAKEAR